MKTHKYRISLAIAASLCCTPAIADLGENVGFLRAADGQMFDRLATSLAMNGDIVVAGAPTDDDLGFEAGSAYLFSHSTETQLFKLLPDDEEPHELFGYSVHTDGVLAIVGEPRHDADGLDGAAYLFDCTTGAMTQKLNSPPFGWLGASVAVRGQFALAGAPMTDSQGHNSGSAALFDSSTGAFIRELLPNFDPNLIADHFGERVALGDGVAVIAAPGNDDAGLNVGAVYVIDLATGAQLFQMTPLNPAPQLSFGRSLDLHGTTAIIGAVGVAYLFDIETGQQIGLLRPESDPAPDEFGASVALNDDLAVVGCPRDQSMSGVRGLAYVYDLDSGFRLGIIEQFEVDAGDRFGATIDIDGERMVVGAPRHDVISTDRGAAFVYDGVAPCYADLNGDGVIDAADLSILIDQFGSNEPLSDLNNDGVVSAADLGVLIQRFGIDCSE